MSLAERLREEVKVEIVERLLMEKVELAFIAKVTGLSLAKIKKIKQVQKKH